MENDLTWLREQIEQLLADALPTNEQRTAELERRDVSHADGIEASDGRHAEELAQRDLDHARDVDRRNQQHAAAIRAQDERHAADVENLQRALATRDVIGQAKGIIMVTMNCSADEAFELLRLQSQAENVKLADVAAEIAGRTRVRVSRSN